MQKATDSFVEQHLRKSLALREICRAVEDEVVRACGKHPKPINSLHEGHSIIREEFDEFWDEVKAQKPDAEAIRMELIQTAAMCVRTLLEVPLA